MFKYLFYLSFLIITVYAEDSFIFDFNKSSGDWFAVNDNVMGGLSNGNSSLSDQKLIFSGNLSLENNGGFSSIRSPKVSQDLTSCKGIQLRVKGDGRNYLFNIYTNIRIPAGSYRGSFTTTAGKWTEIFIPFTEFQATSFGRAIPFFPSLNRKQIKRLGFMVSDKKPGPFRLEIEWIKAIKKTSQSVNIPLNLLQKLESNEDTSFFYNLVEKTKYKELLASRNNFTVIVPHDSIFEQMPKRDRELIKNNELVTIFFLSIHLSPNTQITDSSNKLNAFLKENFDVENASKKIISSNGVLYVVKKSTPSFKEFLIKGSLEELVEFTIEKGAPIYNMGYVSICTKIYYLSLNIIYEQHSDKLSKQLKSDLWKSINSETKDRPQYKRAWDLRALLDRVYSESKVISQNDSKVNK
ncbi:CIA30 family protein [Candidatus Uabimicrobium sp. HlEnr_7]|uniref:CIA30 family protein n=1 Tax=Candidatus Uabimicrobium helgolandensis TaxID=3095367 RepID=UPI003558FAF0